MPGSDNDIQYNAGIRIEASSSRGVGNMQKTATDCGEINWDVNPEGVVAANPGSTLRNRTSPASYWFKETGTGNTGWVQVTTGTASDLYQTPYIVDAAGGPGSDYTSIQDAIDQAAIDNPSGTSYIFVRPGTYSDNLTITTGDDLVISSIVSGDATGNLVRTIISGTVTQDDGVVQWSNLQISGTQTITSLANCRYYFCRLNNVTLSNSSGGAFFNQCTGGTYTTNAVPRFYRCQSPTFNVQSLTCLISYCFNVGTVTMSGSGNFQAA